MGRTAALPARLLVPLLTGLLPVQVGLAGLLGAAARDHDPHAGHFHAAPAAYQTPAAHATAHEHGTAAAVTPGGDEDADPQGAQEPCGETGPCDTGLMTCSDGAPCATVAFFPSAADVPPEEVSRALASPAAGPEHGDSPFGADPPPPRA